MWQLNAKTDITDITISIFFVLALLKILNCTPQILLCCSNNGHYDVVYPKNYPVDAAVCQGELNMFCEVQSYMFSSVVEL